MREPDTFATAHVGETTSNVGEAEQRFLTPFRSHRIELTLAPLVPRLDAGPADRLVVQLRRPTPLQTLDGPTNPT